MAMDNFKEEIVVRKRNGFANFTYYLAWTMLVFFGVIGIFMMQAALNTIGSGAFAWGSLIVSLIMIALAALLWIKKDGLRVEYEYTFTNGVLDISMVLNNSKRRYLSEINMKIVDSIGSVNHPSFNRYLSDKNIKRHNWFLNRGANLTYLYFSKNGVRHLVIIEPSQEMLDMINSRGYLNFGVWQG
ncbi:MAG: hypothetical protein IKJ65_08825 [Clostridia bacterium]|nr:hypothetical protein [Clostridia bacterium]